MGMGLLKGIRKTKSPNSYSDGLIGGTSTFAVIVSHSAFMAMAAPTLTPIPSVTTLNNQIHGLQLKFSVFTFNPPSQSRRRTVGIRLSSSPNHNQNQSSPGLYSAKKFELTASNVDLVLEDVRPYLIADGGNVDVVSVEDGVVSLRLQGACESCPSSTTTMTMGIERVLKEKFGDAVKDIRQVYDNQPKETTVEAVNSHLDILRAAIKNYGGSVEVLSVEGEECQVRYVGPDSIGSGIKAAIKERFPDILNVTFSA